MEQVGADPLRWYLMSSPILRGGDLQDRPGRFGHHDVVRLVINPIWNAYSFFCRYANVDGYTATERSDATGQLDRYILAKTSALVGRVTAADGHLRHRRRVPRDRGVHRCTQQLVHPPEPRPVLGPGIGSRRHDRAPTNAMPTTRCSRCSRRCSGSPRRCCRCSPRRCTAGSPVASSVHLDGLARRPTALPADDELVAAMDKVRAVCSAALGLREDAKLRTRLPLRRLVDRGRRRRGSRGADVAHRGRGQREGRRVHRRPLRLRLVGAQAQREGVGPGARQGRSRR